MSTRPTPQAMRVPVSMVVGHDFRARLLWLKHFCAPVLGLDSVAVFALGETYFVADCPQALLKFPIGHPRQGEDRYRWERAKGGLEYGYLVDGAEKVPGPVTLNQILDHHLDKHRQMLERGIIDQEHFAKIAAAVEADRQDEE